MSVRTVVKITCDGCGKDDVEIVSTRTAQLSFGKIRFVEANQYTLFREPDRRRRDYCQDCVESGIYYCENCQKPHRDECPIEAAELNAWYERFEANKDHLAETQY